MLLLVQLAGIAVVAENFVVDNDASVCLDDEGSADVRLVSSGHPRTVVPHVNIKYVVGIW